jgi:glycosyltransferase involved in cell wall biosynthesis
MPAPLIAVVIATRDRPALFGQALASVLAQQGADFEVIVVDDGSSVEARAAYAEVLAAAAKQLGGRLKHVQLARRATGHGPGFARNSGAALADASYLGFLDDDDSWTDTQHLARFGQAVLRASEQARELDLYLCNQQAWLNGQPLPGPIWIETLQQQLRDAGRPADPDGSYAVDVQDLMRVEGFGHLNTLVVRRALFEAIGGFDEQIRFEEDREIYLRILDSAQHIVHQPALVARHNVPDRQAGNSASARVREIERRLWQLRVLDKTVALLRQPALRAHAMRHKGYALKRIAHELAAQRDWRVAAFYAREALAVQPSVKWALFTASLAARRLLPGK